MYTKKSYTSSFLIDLMSGSCRTLPFREKLIPWGERFLKNSEATKWSTQTETTHNENGYLLKQIKQIHKDYPLWKHDSATKQKKLVARWQMRKVRSTLLQKHYQGGLWEQTVIRRPQSIMFYPNLMGTREVQEQQSSQRESHFQGKHAFSAKAPNAK